MDMIEMSLKCGADNQSSGYEEPNALALAITAGKLAATNFLLDKGLQLSSYEDCHEVFSSAPKVGQADCVLALVNHKSTPSVFDIKYWRSGQ